MTTYILQCPLKGWDTKTSLADQEEGYATLLDNYIPNNRFLELRKGFTPYLVVNNASNLKTLIPLLEKNKLIACGDGKIYDAINSNVLADNLLNDNWQSCYFRNNIFLSNGNDITKRYDGESVQNINFTFAENVPEVPLNFAFNYASNQQLLFVKEDDLGFYYAPVGDTQGGELNYFNLSQIAQKGGKLLAIASWGKDSSQGYHGYTAFVTSEGEIIVYEGEDFSSQNVGIVGNFFTSRPIGRRCIVNWGADIIIITEKGYIPISQITANGEVIKHSILFSDKISGAVLERSRLYANSNGWLGVVSSQEHFALFNVPYEQEFEQHIMNLETGAWCRFKGINANDWIIYQGQLLFCMNDTIYIYNGTSDILKNDGNPDSINYIYGEIKNVYSKLGNINPKLLQVFNSRIECDQRLKITYSVGIDYEDRKYDFEPTEDESGFYWADADTPPDDNTTRLWDEGDWSGGLEDISRWYSISGWGVSISLQIKTQTNTASVRIYESLINFEISRGALK